jgi:peptidoglycan/LPS O-acetylase OafA/YrhL
VLIAGYSYFVHSWLLPFGPPQLYYSLVSALPFFMAGIFLADLYASGAIRRSRSLMWDGIAVIGLAAFLYCQIIQAAYRFFWLSPLMIMMVVVGGIKGHVTNRFLRFRPVTLIGGMCYSIYLWHIPILSMLGSHVRPVPHQLSDTQASLLFCVVAAPLIIVITTPIYYFTEKPFMNGQGSRFIERILRAAYAQFQRKPIVASTEAS